LRRLRHNAPAQPRLTALQTRAASACCAWHRASPEAANAWWARVGRVGRRGWRGKEVVGWRPQPRRVPAGRRLRPPRRRTGIRRL